MTGRTMNDRGELDLRYGLHDSFIRRIHTNAAEATAGVVVESLHLNEFYKYPSGSVFEIHFSGVDELHVLVSRRCGTMLASDGQPLRRFESASWTEFENSFSDERGSFEDDRYENGRYEVIRAHATYEGQLVIFTIDEIVDWAGFSVTESDFLTQLKIVATHGEVRCPDGDVRSLEEFTALGEAYRRSV